MIDESKIPPIQPISSVDMIMQRKDAWEEREARITELEALLKQEKQLNIALYQNIQSLEAQLAEHIERGKALTAEIDRLNSVKGMAEYNAGCHEAKERLIRENQELTAQLAECLRVIKKHHEWHNNHDQEAYEESNLCEQTMKALSTITPRAAKMLDVVRAAEAWVSLIETEEMDANSEILALTKAVQALEEEE